VVGAHEGGEGFSAKVAGLQAVVLHPPLHGGHLQRALQRLVQARGHLARGACGQEHAVPALGTETRVGLGHGGHLGQLRHAPRRAHCQRTQPAGADVRQRVDEGVEHHLHLLAEQGVERRRRAAVGDVGQEEAAPALHHLHHEVGCGTAAVGGVVQRPGWRRTCVTKSARLCQGVVAAATSTKPPPALVRVTGSRSRSGSKRRSRYSQGLVVTTEPMPYSAV
jgi:hypothetical protein